MPNKIQFRRGTLSNLPSLDAGEPGVTTDTQDFYFGTGTGTIRTAKWQDMVNMSMFPSSYALDISGMTIGTFTIPIYQIKLGTITLG